LNYYTTPERGGDMKKGFVLFVSLVMSTSGYGYIYDITILRRWNRPTNSYQYIIGCSDYHDTTHSIGKAQREELLKLFSAIDKDNTLIIVEDLGSPNGSAFYVCDTLRLSPNDGLLSSFASACKVCQLDVCNIEYRYARVIALSEIIRYPERNFFASKAACTLRVGQVCQEIMHTIHEIRAYQDCLSVTLAYHHICRSIERIIRGLQLNVLQNDSIAQLCQSNCHIPGFIKHLLTFDSRLLDCKGVHTIINAPHKKKIVLLAGGTHIDRMSEMLILVGFEYITSIKPIQSNGLSRSLNVSGTKSAHKPKRVGLEIVREYLLK
jgi:hypothetical protein